MPTPVLDGLNKKIIRKRYLMAKKRTVENVIHSALKNKIAFGQSKHEDKKQLGFGKSNYKIYSYSTYNTYLKECNSYAQWLKEEKGINTIKDLQETEKHAAEYLQHRLNNGASIYTVKMEKAALGMLYSHTIDIDLPKRDNKNITRSRLKCKNDSHYSRNGIYKNVFTIALATGCRRCDLKKLKTDCLVERNGNLYIKINGSKGGRDRLAYVRREYTSEVRKIVSERQKDGYKTVFNKIPPKIDIHSLRREYCQKLYKEIEKNPQLRDTILKEYPKRMEYKFKKDKDGNTRKQEIKSNFYKDSDGNIWERDTIYVLSQCLGHNRLDVTITHYLK